ncbi:MAG: hypothetical protein ACON38_06105 [Akkermansiaceae bacterium]
MKKTLVCSLFLAPLLGAAPLNPKEVPAKAQWFVHGDMDAMRKTDSGTILMGAIERDHGEKIAEATEFLGFNPMKDLSDVTLFGDGKMDRAAIVFRGNMNREHLETVISHAEEYFQSAHGETTIHQWQDNGKTQHAAFHGAKTVVISEQKDFVQYTLDVLAGKKPGLDKAPEAASDQPFLMGFANIQNIDLPEDEGSRIVRKAKTIQFALSEKGERLNARMILKANDEATASHLKDAMAGLVAIGSLADDNINNLGIQHQGSVEGDTMDMSMSLSVSKALALLSQMK